MKCQYCKKILSSKSALNAHQKRTKYCLKIQGKSAKEYFSCNICNKNFILKHRYKSHYRNCKAEQYDIVVKEKDNKNYKLLAKNNALYIELEILRKTHEETLRQNKEYRDTIQHIAILATSNNNKEIAR